MMTVSCFSPCLSKGFEPFKNPGPLLDIGEWKEKVCVSIGLLRWSLEKKNHVNHVVVAHQYSWKWKRTAISSISDVNDPDKDGWL